MPRRSSIATGLLDDVPVTTDLGPGRAVAIVGDHGAAVARSLLVQLAALTGPADWRLVVVADDPGEWEWAAWLPARVVRGRLRPRSDDRRSRRRSRLAAVLARLDDGDGRHVVVVTDRPDVLSTRTGALRRYLASAPSVAVVAVVRTRRRRAAAVPQRAAHRQPVHRPVVSRPGVGARFQPGPRRRRVRRRRR